MRKSSISASEAVQATMVPPPVLLDQFPQESKQATTVAPAEPILTPPSTSRASAEKTAILSSYYDKWTWEKSLIHKVQYNKHIQAWMDHSPEFYNWVRSCIMFHADNGCDETRCTIPDQWRDDIGDSITIVTANYLPVRQGTTHISKAGVYHVMN